MARSPADAGKNADVSLPYAGEIVDGKYQIERVLGEGGMGVVLQAHHIHFDQRVAIKVLTARDATALSRFQIEARSTAHLKGEHVARVMDVGTLPSGLPFLVLEYLEGCDLDELIELHGRLPVSDAVDYVLQALEGIAEAHAIGIVHRDLKPANLFLSVQPSGANVIKILDFGISKSIASRRSGKTGNVTADHATLGSPRYMSPEQIRSTKNVDTRSDIWSIGIVLYELLTGETPFDGESYGETFAAILERDAPSLGVSRPDLPRALVEAVDRCLRRDRDERFPDVHEVARAIAPFGNAESAGRVRAIEQTLRNAGAMGEGSGAVSVRIVRAAPDAPTQAAPLEGDALRRVHGQVTAASFTSDTPKGPDSFSTTVVAYVRRSRRRAAIVAASLASLATVAAVAVAIHATRDTAPAVVVAAMPAPPKVAPAPPVVTPAPPRVDVASAAPAPPATGSVAVATRPPPQPAPRAAAPTRARHAAAKPPSPPPRHAPPPRERPSVLDSPD